MKRTRLLALCGVLFTALTLTACDPEDAVTVFVDKVVRGDNVAHALIVRGLERYCQAPEALRLKLRERYDGRVEVHCPSDS